MELSKPKLRELHEVARQVRRNIKIQKSLGSVAKRSPGFGQTVLFVGRRGTGRTFAAKVLSHKMGFDLYRVDLARITSKYIGETEKNLDLIFGKAGKTNQILFFDEADALFVKRSEVKDSHDRFANSGINFLLERMENHPGLIILSTKSKKYIDEAFLRRIRFVVQFP